MNIKKYIIIIVLILVSVGTLFWVFKKKTPTSPEIIIAPTEQAILKLEEEKKDQDILKSLDVILDKTRETDKDLDGLSDEQEKKIGTNPDNPDTDADGLLDSDEINIYHTDPLKDDTDDDSFKDGYEVRRGYNPLGTGELK